MKNILIISILIFLAYNRAFPQSIWNIQQSPTSNDLTSIYFINDSTGWITGYNGTILKTINSGVDWEIQNSGTSKHLSDVFFATENKGWIVGQAYGGSMNNGIVLSTTDGGSNWEIQIDGGLSNLRSVFFINDTVGWAVGADGTIKNTQNSGITWFDQNSGTNRLLTKVQFITQEIGWISVHYLNLSYAVYILKTYNGGQTWDSIFNPLPFSIHEGFHFSDSLHGFATGFGSHVTEKVILKTTDGGYNWQMNGCDSKRMNGIFSTSSNLGWAVGGLFNGYGYVYNTVDGILWSEQTTPTVSKLNELHFINDSIGWAIGDNGTIIHTNQGNIYTNIFRRDRNKNSLYCYPNPSQGLLTVSIELPEKFLRVEIYTYLGELILVDEINTNLINASLTYDLGYLKSGLYIVKLYGSNLINVVKWIKH